MEEDDGEEEDKEVEEEGDKQPCLTERVVKLKKMKMEGEREEDGVRAPPREEGRLCGRGKRDD